jgi:hypothetical protein
MPGGVVVVAALPSLAFRQWLFETPIPQLLLAFR